jgi:tetratricopeptide (TPR) repeat protein
MATEEAEQISRKLEKANELRLSGNPIKAVTLLQNARKRWPKNANILTDLATCYACIPEFKKAEKCLHQLLERFPKNKEVLLFAAELQSSMRQLNTSLATYEQATKLHPDSAPAWMKAAEIHERQNRLEDSRECLERALQLDPKSEMARFQEAVLLTREKRFEEASQSLCDLLQSGLNDREVHWKTGHQLAMVMDKMGEFESAAQVWLASKEGMEANYAPEIKKAREEFEKKASLIRKLTTELTSARLESWKAQGAGSLQPRILAGHPRSGTTLLETMLDRHSMLVSLEETTCMENEIFHAVFGSHAAETELFDARFLDRLSSFTFRQAGKHYQKSARQFLGEQSEDVTLLDKNPMLTHFLGVALRFFPELKSLVMIRDPRDVCLSCFQQGVGVVTTNVPWLRVEDTMKAYRDIMGVWIKVRDLIPEQGLEVRYEDLVKNPETEARKAVEFLGLSWEEQTLEPQQEGRTIFSPTYADAAKPVYQSAVRRWDNYENILGPHLPLLHDAMREFGYS